MKLTEIFFLINPFSGKKQSDKLVHLLRTKYPEISYHISFSSQEAKVVMMEKIEKFSVFVIAGGDGTINQAIPFFVSKKDKLLAVYPMGSGNGFAMESGFCKNLKKLIESIKKGETTDVDILRCNEHYAINVAGIGLDGYIADLFMHQKKRGLLKYALLTMKALTRFSPFSADIKTGDHTVSGMYMGIVIANTRQFGNRAYIAPQSDPTDGKADVVLIQKMPLWQIALFFIRLFTHGIRDNKYISYWQTAENVRIKTAYTFAHTDGEPFTVHGYLDVQVIPGAVRLIKISR